MSLVHYGALTLIAMGWSGVGTGFGAVVATFVMPFLAGPNLGLFAIPRTVTHGTRARRWALVACSVVGVGTHLAMIVVLTSPDLTYRWFALEKAILAGFAVAHMLAIATLVMWRDITVLAADRSEANRVSS